MYLVSWTLTYTHTFRSELILMRLPLAEFWAYLAASVVFYYDDGIDNPDATPPENMLPIYDFIVVGAGASGSVVASRLSDNDQWNVLLLEAGGEETSITETPFLAPLFAHTDFDWNYTTVKQDNACRASNGTCIYIMGRALGGSTAIQDMVYVRGNKEDYNDWCTLYGNRGWCYEDLLPYFKVSENASDKIEGDTGYHGVNGPLTVQRWKFSAPLRQVYIKAAKEYGFDEIDYNGESQSGIGTIQATINGRLRMSNARAFLNPVSGRRNLDIGIRSEVTRILIDENTKKATGVEFVKEGRVYSVGASKEVILSAGAVNTPKLLMLSGIGLKDHLESLKIPVISDLPVGNNMQDHVFVSLMFSFNDSSLMAHDDDVYTNESIIEYAKYGKGPLTNGRTEVTVFVNAFERNLRAPNIQYLMMTNAYNTDPDVMAVTDKIPSALSCVMNIKPVSRGTVRLSSSSYASPPLINPNSLKDEIDKTILKKGLQILLEIMETPTMKSYGAQFLPLFPNCQNLINNTSDFLDCVVLEYSAAGFHPVGTARMGPKDDKSSVVSDQLLVHGVDNLRVIDASIMPSITRGNTAAVATVIGEKGADLIKDRYLTRFMKMGFAIMAEALVEIFKRSKDQNNHF